MLCRTAALYLKFNLRRKEKKKKKKNNLALFYMRLYDIVPGFSLLSIRQGKYHFCGSLLHFLDIFQNVNQFQIFFNFIFFYSIESFMLNISLGL